jgi:beta-1,4-mannosyl-glycoprotein beta-1,4-N-acetylglucosaminyltransferase
MNILDSYVDFFVITESDVTFSGDVKPLFFQENRDRFQKFEKKIIHNPVFDTPSGKDVSPFDRDVFQKNARSRPLSQCQPNDIIIFSDLDEIPDPLRLKKYIDSFDANKVYHFAQRQFYFFINLEEISGRLLSYAGDFPNANPPKWLGSYMMSYELFKTSPIEVLRVEKRPQHSIRIDDGGWHFTYMGGDSSVSVANRVAQKIKYAAHQEFNTKKVHSNLEENIYKGRDIFGRRAKFRITAIDDSFPEYLVKNIYKYQHLIAPKNLSTQVGFLMHIKMWVKDFLIRSYRLIR